MTSESNSHDREDKTLSERLDGDFALKAAQLGVWELDPATRLMHGDSRCRELFGGVEAGPLPYEQILHQIHPDDVSRVDRAFNQAMDHRSGGACDVTCRTIGTGDGRLRRVRFVGQGYFTDAGALHRFGGIAQEVTQETPMPQSEVGESQFRSLIEETPVATCLFVSRALTIELANEAMIDVWGKGWSVIGKPLIEALPELEGQPFLQLIDEVFTTGNTHETKAGPAKLVVNGVLSTYYFDYTFKAVRTGNGEIYAVMETAVDVTEQVLADERVRESERYFRQLTETVPAIIWITRPDGYCTYLNQQWYNYTGQTSEQAEGFGWLDATYPDDKDEAGRRFIEANQQRVPFDVLYRLRHKDGSYRWAVDKGSPQFGANGDYKGMIGTVVDVNDQIVAQQQLVASAALFKNVTSSAPTGLWLSDEAGGLTYLNSTLVDWTGLPYPDLLGAGWASAIIEQDRQRSADAFAKAVADRAHYDVMFRIKKGDGRVIWCQAAGDPYYHEDGAYAGYAGFCMDVDELLNQREALQLSEARLRSVVANAPAAIGLFVGRELVIEMPNQAFIDIVGKGPDIVGKPLRTVMPELESQSFLQILDDVYTSGRMYQSFGAPVDIVQQGVMTHNFYNITYTPLFDAGGNVYAILDIAIDVTERVIAQQRLEESQLQLLTSFEQAPVGIALIVGDELTFRMANPYYGRLAGRSPDELVGEPLLEVLPELRGQGFDDLLRSVMDTGVPYVATEVPVTVARISQLETIYVNMTYQPRREVDPVTETERISGVLVVATDVTDQVLIRQKVEQAQTALQGAVELAELGTWQIDFNAGILHYSARLRQWFGFEEDERITFDRAYSRLRPADVPRVRAAVMHAITPGTDNIYDIEYTLDAAQARQNRILHVQGKAYFNAKGEVYLMSGMAQDVTEQRNRQLALERQVQERTEELAASNEELAATNEELAATNEELAIINEELTESNQLLIRSNENLQQFAYIASHDLQEPLRKIQSFGDLLKNRYATALGEGVDHLERMQAAASRMSTLIRDLLAFSRISTQQDTITVVSLTQVMAQVLTDLELRIQETEAIVEVGPLPTVSGDAVQLGQLCQNLISNALKFRRVTPAGVAIPPRIQVSAWTVAFTELPPLVKPTRQSILYYRIDVADNGIGFDDKYVDRIFQVFQRLHGKGEFAGTGIGLAICEKVAANHGGAITASSQPGQGATFSVFFPTEGARS